MLQKHDKNKNTLSNANQELIHSTDSDIASYVACKSITINNYMVYGKSFVNGTNSNSICIILYVGYKYLYSSRCS